MQHSNSLKASIAIATTMNRLLLLSPFLVAPGMATVELVTQDIYQTQCDVAFTQDFTFDPENMFEPGQLGEEYWQNYLENVGIIETGETIEYESVDIVVIGAGMAGVTATKVIMDHNRRCKSDRYYTQDPRDCETSYVLLEATDRVGGVIKRNQGFMSENYTNGIRKNVAVEDGPNWIGGDFGNPVFDYAMNVVDPPLRVYPQDFTSHESFTVEGVTINKHEIWAATSRYENFYYEPLDAIAADSESEHVINGTSIRDVLVNELGYPTFENQSDIDEFVLWYNIDYSDGGSAADSSVATWPINTFNSLYDYRWDNKEPWNYAFGGYYLEYIAVDERGLEAIPQTFAKKELKIEKNDNIFLGEEVCKVMHHEDQAIVITSSNKVFLASKVIPTLNPTLYLNEPINNGVSPRNLFQPALYESLEDFPFLLGNYTMIYYQFPSQFWENKEFINVVYPKDQVGKCGWFQNLSMYMTAHRFEDWYSNLDKDAPTILSENPGIDRFNWKGPDSYILKCLLTTSAMNELDEGLTQDVVLNDFLEPLRRKYQSFVEPKKVYIPQLFSGDNVDSFLVGIKEGVGRAARDEFNNLGSRSIHVSGTQACEAWAGWMHGAWGGGILAATEALDDLHQDINITIPIDCVPLQPSHVRAKDPRLEKKLAGLDD